jgi:uncharacterized protein (TIGR01244 family)
MQPVALSDVIAVGEVPTEREIEILAGAGFRSLLNVQPEGEVERHLTSAQAETLARKAGLEYRHLPVESRRPTAGTVSAFADALREMPRPIYACCYSGSRAAAAWALAVAQQSDSQSIVAACAAAGYDISFMAPQLDAVRERGLAVIEPPASADAEAPVAPANDAHLNGAKAGNGAHDGAQRPIAPLPRLEPSILLPRAASAGGFAVAG